MYKIGIDVGGTNTDAVIMNEQQQVIANVKAPTTQDVESGIYDALDRILKQSAIDPSRISSVMLGHNACYERDH